jgi:hypothetical protein
VTSETFTCAHCGDTHEKGWTDEEAMAEAEGLLSGAELEDLAVVCDDCWRNVILPGLPRVRAEVDQEAAAAGMSYDEFLRQAEPAAPVVARPSGRYCYTLPLGNRVHVKPGCRCPQ